MWLSRTKETTWLQFCPNVRFINIKLFICMYANIVIFNPEVINNLVGDNNFAQSEVRGETPSNACLERTVISEMDSAHFKVNASD